ncbi:MAG TPA: hypothetical protein VFC23_12920 [Thermoanaerobaculia bacterium]|nr:hypothetical protein [Thermoanaerobaculia bacterium]
MAPRFALFAALLSLLAGLTASASAQNLLVNPEFDNGLNGWQTFGQTFGGVTVSWDGLDADGSPTSGSARAVWQGPVVTGLVPVLSQCVEVTPGSPYVFGGKIFIPSGQATPGSAFFIALPYPSPGCSGTPPPSPFVETPPVTSFDRWTETAATIVPFGPSLLVSAYLAPNAGGSFQASYDDVILEPHPPGGCIPDARTLCFASGRFKVTATFDTGNGNAGQAQGVPAGDSGLLWFFAPTNVEVALKVLDGCALGGHYWFFAGGLTNVQVTILVTDTQTGATRTYRNPLGTAFAPIQDTAAFNCSP